YYDPRIGRWISADPLYKLSPGRGIGDPRRLNLNAFALNNPVSVFDQTGLDACGAEAPACVRRAVNDQQPLHPLGNLPVSDQMSDMAKADGSRPPMSSSTPKSSDSNLLKLPSRINIASKGRLNVGVRVGFPSSEPSDAYQSQFLPTPIGVPGMSTA